MEQDPMTIEDILRMREVGQLESALDDKAHYLLVAYQVYPNGTTANEFVTDPQVARQIGEKMGLGAPTDPKGWGIWDCDKETPDAPKLEDGYCGSKELHEPHDFYFGLGKMRRCPGYYPGD